MQAFVGTAAWSIPKEFAPNFPGAGTHLERYSQQLSAVEINSSFYREHKPTTYQRWSESVPASFRFAVKLSKTFTHEQKLNTNPADVQGSLAGIKHLGPKLGALLVQLPPSLAFDDTVSQRFFAQLRRDFTGLIALEPRHKSWVLPPAIKVLEQYSLTKVFADPEPCPPPTDNEFFGKGEVYFRLHGTPEIYKSNYEKQKLREIYSQTLEAQSRQCTAWCIFDNTTFGFATGNALQMESFKKEAFLLDSLHA